MPQHSNPVSVQQKTADFIFNHLIASHPLVTVVLAVLFTGLTGFGARNLIFDTDYRMFFDADNPQLASYETLQKIFAKDDSVVLTVEPADQDIFDVETLKLVHSMSEEAWQLPYSLRVDSVANFTNPSAEGDDIVIRALVEDPEILDDLAVEKVKKIALSEPAILGSLVSPDGSITALKVTFALPKSSPELLSEVVSRLDIMLKTFREAYPNHRFRATGNLLAGNSFAEAAQIDLKTLIPLMYGLIIFLLYSSFRSWFATFLVIVNVAVSSIVAMGFMGWVGWNLSTSTAIAPTIIMTLAVSDAVHLLGSHFFYRNQGLDRHGAMRKALRDNFLPMFLTSVTTIIGFLSLNFNNVPPFRELGTIVSVGVFAAFVAVITIIPALVLLFNDGFKPTNRQGKSLVWVAGTVDKYPRHIFWGGSALALACLLLLPNLEVNDDVVKYFDRSFVFRTDSDAIVKKLGGFDRIEYAIDSGAPQGVTDPAYLLWLESFVDYVRSQPEVSHVDAVGETFRKINQVLNGDNKESYQIPQSKALAAQYLLLYEMSLPQGKDLTNQINIDKSSSRVSISLWGLTSADMLAVTHRLDDWLLKNPHLKVPANRGTGLSIIFANIYKENIVGMVKGTLVALFLITITIVLLLRSLKLGLISLVPNIIPMVITFGIWALAVGVIDLASSAIAMLTLGLVVDDTIHFLSKFNQYKKTHQASNGEAVSYVIKSVGSALWTTSLVLFSGFAVLGFSGFKLNMSMGILTSVTIAVALAADLFFLPSMLILLDGTWIFKKQKMQKGT